MSQDDRVTAVKVIKPELVDQDDDTELVNMAKEIRILKQCNHPNIVSMYGSYKDDEYVYVSGTDTVFFIFCLAVGVGKLQRRFFGRYLCKYAIFSRLFLTSS